MNPVAFIGTPFPVEEPKAANPQDGAMLDYFLKSAPQGGTMLEIYDANGGLVRRVSSNDPAPPPRPPGDVADGWFVPLPRLTANAGMNRFAWDLRYGLTGTDADDEDDFGHPTPGPQVLPGTYEARLIVGGKTFTQSLEVGLDPRLKTTAKDLSSQLELSLSIVKAIGQAAQAIRADPKNSERVERLRAIASDLTTALRVAESADRTPPATAYQIFEEKRKELEGVLAGGK